jgi:hypothetical protein
LPAALLPSGRAFARPYFFHKPTPISKVFGAKKIAYMKNILHVEK